MQNKGFLGKLGEAANLRMDTYIASLRKSYNKMFGVNQATMRRSWEVDLEQRSSEYGYIVKPTLLTDQHKTLMWLRNPIIAAIVQTRVTQAVPFAVPQKDKYTAGFLFERKDGEQFGDNDKVNCERLKEFICKTGITDEERDNAEENMTFEKFIKLIVKDSLIYDTIAIEIVPNHMGQVHHFLPAAGSSIRIAAPNIREEAINDYWSEIQDKEFDPKKAELGKYKHVQVVNNQIRRAFTKEQLIVEHRNPMNDLWTKGYPVAELDLLMNVVTAHTNAETFNRSLFTNGVVSSGIINLKGDVDDEQLKALRRSWYAQGVGSDNMFKTPIINSPEGIEFIKLDVSHKEMEYSTYINYLIKLMCGIYQMDPEEIGFQSSGAAEGSGGNSQNYNNVEKRLHLSRDRGLRPLLRFIENIINEQILPKFNKQLADTYKFSFVGLNAEDREAELSRHEREVKNFKSVNEVRKEQGLQPIVGCDNVILNADYLNWFMTMSEEGKQFNKEQTEEMMRQAQQQQDMAASAGEGGLSGDVNYVDESGNALNPEEVDPENMSFFDEDGSPVDLDGNPLSNEDEALPEESASLEGDSSLPFEDDDLPF